VDNSLCVSKAVKSFQHTGEIPTDTTSNGQTDDDSAQHPYANELSDFHPHGWQLTPCGLMGYRAVRDTPFTLVDTHEQFDQMLSTLKSCREIALDLEHHSYRSFQGLVCIIQISTREEDFVVDTIALKEEIFRLNEVCTNSNILKVLHGCERDIEWLQRDFGVFVVNLFDTQKAARAIQEESISLAHILQKYCHVTVNKRYQLSDWRTRPIPEDMLHYAREDSHYLLHIKDIYQNALLTGTKTCQLLDVYTASTAICRMLYREPVFHADSYLTCYRKTKGKLNPQQMECFRLLYEWRHHISKEHDESPGYTLPNKMMLKIAHDLPKDAQAVALCCVPLPALVYSNLETIHRLVLRAIANVPEVVSEDDDDRLDEESIHPLLEKTPCADRVWAIAMVNDLFLMQLKLRPEIRSLPDAAPLLKWEKMKNDVT